ncbi:MAG: MFS transporter [Spirochaetes bacterium]|nr:MAG: MFS transporter [Spirochaetota bacterium]
MSKPQIVPQETSAPLSLLRKLGYGVGDFASNITWQVVRLYLLFFYTDVFGITAAEAGVIFLVSRVWDAIFDPMIGYIADHTHTRWGKFRPYILFGSLPLGIILVMTFTTPDLGHDGKFVWALVSYLLLVTLYSAVNLPFSSLTAAMTQDTNERGTLSGFRVFFAILAGILVAVSTLPLVNSFPTKEIGFRNVLIIFSAIATIVFFITFLSTRERISVESHVGYSLKEALRLLMANKPLIALSMSVFFLGIANTMTGATSLYFIKYNLKREDLYPVYALFVALCLIVGVVLSTIMSKRIGKKNMYYAAIAIGMAVNVGVFVTPYSNIGLIFILGALGGIGGGAGAQLMWSMAPDTVEYAEWKTGLRAEGLTYSAFSFVQKLDTAIGGAFAGMILAFVGYVPNGVQTGTALNGILGIMTIAPFTAGILGIFCMRWYSLDSVRFNTIVSELKERKIGTKG